MSNNPKLEPGQWFAKAQRMTCRQFQDARAALLPDQGSNPWLLAATDAAIEECLQSQARSTKKQPWWVFQGFKHHTSPHDCVQFVIAGWQKWRLSYPADVTNLAQGDKYRNQWKIAVALNRVTVLFRTLWANRSSYSGSQSSSDIFQAVDDELECGAEKCQRLVEEFVSARRNYLQQHPQLTGHATTLTNIVDNWIAFVDSQPTNQPAKSRDLPLPQATKKLDGHLDTVGSGPSTATVDSTATPNSRKRKAPSLESSNAKKRQTPAKKRGQGVQRDADATPVKREERGKSEESSLFVEDSPKALERSDLESHTKKISHPQSPPMSSSHSSPSSQRNKLADESSVSGTGLEQRFEKLSKLVAKRHVRYNARYDRLKFRSANPKQRLDSMEREAIDSKALWADMQGQLSRLSDELAEEREIQKLLQSSTNNIQTRFEDNGEFFQRLVDKTKAIVKDQVRLTWQGAALEVAHKMRDMNSMYQEQNRQIVDLQARKERQEMAGVSRDEVKETAQKIEETLDKEYLIQQRGMERLHKTVAAQAAVIEEQGKELAEMRRQISKLTKERSSSGLWSKESDGQSGADVGLLWSPQG